MFKVKTKGFDNVFDVYAADFGRTGPITFLLYSNGQWFREPADSFEPYVDTAETPVIYYNVIVTVKYPFNDIPNERWMYVSTDQTVLETVYGDYIITFADSIPPIINEVEFKRQENEVSLDWLADKLSSAQMKELHYNGHVGWVRL